MIIYAVYVISSDGRTIVSKQFQSTETMPNEILLGGLIVALQGVASEMTDGQSDMKGIDIEGLSYHIRSFGFYRIVIVTAVPTPPEDMIQTLGLRFMRQFGEKMIDDSLDVSIFDPFKEVIREVIESSPDASIDIRGSINPSKKLSTSEIFSLPHHLHSTALALLTIQEGTLEDVANEVEKPKEVIKTHLNELQTLGFVGMRHLEDRKLFFCSI